MNHPLQNPPVDRLYMRTVVGRQGLPEPAETGRKAGGKGPRKKTSPSDADYLVELTTIHMRPRWPGGRA
jgi:hypothetical protein